MAKHALIVINVGPVDTATWSRPLMRRYCERYNLDYVEIRDEQFGFNGLDHEYSYLNFEKFQAFDALADYERILRLDTDVLISPTAPNVFERVPEDGLGIVYEDCGTKADKRYADMEQVARALQGDPWGRRRYFNSGVMVISRTHRDAFRLTDQDRQAIAQGLLGGPKEQNLCNWKAREAGCACHELDYRFNHMRMFSERWNGAPHRLGSFFIHYAGSQRRKVHRMRRDHARLLAAWEDGVSPLPWWYRWVRPGGKAMKTSVKPG